MNLEHVCTHPVHDFMSTKRSRDPTNCGALRQRLDTTLRRAAMRWKSAIWRVIVREDALGVSKRSVHTWEPADRLDRFTGFARAEANQQFTLRGPITSIFHAVYSKGYNRSYFERQTEPRALAERNSAIYATQMTGEVKLHMETGLQQMTRAVAIGVMSGERTTKIYSRVFAVMRKTVLPRLQTSGHTLISQAYNHGKLHGYRNLGVERVGVIAESRPQIIKYGDARVREDLYIFTTAGDDLVCPQCGDLEGNVYTLDEASRIIPVHPNCRCVVVER